MRVAIEALGIQNSGGGRSATINLLEHMVQKDTQNEYLVILSKSEPSLQTTTGNVKQWIAPTKNRFATRIWAQMALPIKLRNYDLVHFTKNLGVFGLSIPTIVTIFDLTILTYPDYFPRSDVFYWNYIEKNTARTASRIISISKTTADDLVRFYQIPSEKIRIIYPGRATYLKPARASEMERVQRTYHLTRPYLLCVGRLDRKKNLVNLVIAFSILKNKNLFGGKLVIVGETYEKSPDTMLLPTISRLGIENDVVFTGRVPDEDISPLYSGALACIFPSLHEGFGIVALEALACGTPLIAHHSGAVSEVASGASILCDASQPENLVDGIVRTIQDDRLREELCRLGLIRANQFDWDKSAAQTLEVYNEVAKSPNVIITNRN